MTNSLNSLINMNQPFSPFHGGPSSFLVLRVFNSPDRCYGPGGPEGASSALQKLAHYSSDESEDATASQAEDDSVQLTWPMACRHVSWIGT